MGSTPPGGLANLAATHISAAFPSASFDNHTGLGSRTGGAGDAWTLMYFPRPFPLGASIVSATLRLYSQAMTTGTHTFNFQRFAVGWHASKVTWNTRPTALIAGVKTLTQSGVLADKVAWSLDVTDWMQSIASGGVNYGWRIQVTEAIVRYFYSEISPETAYRPRLEVNWSDQPSPPTGLAPSGGRKVGVPKPILRANYIDVSGSTVLYAAQVQMNATDVWNPVAPGPTFDTSTVLTSTPEVDLTQPFPRTVQAGTTNTSTNITGGAGNFETADIGATIVGAGIPGGATITAVAAGGGSATISAAATATATIFPVITRTHPGLTDGQVVFWRIRLQDAAGIWSNWSAATTFQYDTKGVLTVNSPSSGTPTVEDTTPPILWSFTGETQAAVQLQITHVENGVLVTDWDSGKITTTATSMTVPAGKITEVGKTFTLTVRVWDNKQREATPGSPTYSEVVRNFTFVPGATTGTTGLTAVGQDPRPAVLLTWQRTTAPDGFHVLRNGKVIATNLSPGALFTTGTSYAWTDYSPSPGRSLLYTVQAVVNGVASATNATATVTVRSRGIWLREPVTGLEVVITGKDERPFTLAEGSAVLRSIAPDAVPMVINQSLGGLEGKIEGKLVDYAGKTAQEWRDLYLKMRNMRVKRFYLTTGDYTFLVVCDGFTYQQRTDTGGRPAFVVSFNFYQQDSVNSLLLGS